MMLSLSVRLFPLLLIMPTVVVAHVTSMPHDHVESSGGAFLHGLIHPLTGLDHLLAMVAFGAWLATASKWTHRIAGMGAFLWLMLVGALVGLLHPALPFAEMAVAATVVVAGALLFSGRAYSLGLGLPIATGFAMAHGYAHGTGFVESAALSYFVGFLLTSAVLILGSTTAALALFAKNYQLAVQRAGAAVAVAGFVFVYLAV